MPLKFRRGNLSSTSSLQSLTSSIDASIREEIVPQPLSLTECDDQLQTYQILLQAKSKRKAELIENLKFLRSEKEPLLKIKLTLQDEISASNQLINTKSEEVTQIKHKLRHHSERQIQVNIERLEIQLRNNNYKPKEEQKILDEIFVLKKSFKSLREFELKQRENKKYREERSRLIEQRNEVFSKIQSIILQEEEIKREVAELRHIIHSSEKSIDHLNTVRPELEIEFAEDQRKKKEFKLKKQKEKVNIRREQSLFKQKERQKRWEEYEASREPYEEEKDVCKRLLAYLNSSLPTTPSKKDETEAEEFVSCVSSLHISSSSPSGSFYSKPQYFALERTPSKKKKVRDKKKEQKASKKRELSHPPDVLSSLGKFSFPIPKTTEDVPNCIKLIEQKLEFYNSFSKTDEKMELKEDNISGKEINQNILPCSDLIKKNCSQNSFEEKETNQISHSLSCSNSISVNDSLPHSSNSSSIVLENNNSHNGSNQINSLNFSDSKFISDSSYPTSYFSLAVPVVPGTRVNENALSPTYASVAAGIKV